MKINADELITYQEELATNRSTWESTWQDILDYTMPNRAPIVGRDMPGEDRSIEIYDSTAAHSTTRLAAALNSMLTNQQSKWFLLETTNEQLNKERDVKQWLEDMTMALLKQLYLSNFYSQVHELYLDLASIGTGILYIERAKEIERQLNFSVRHVREIYIAESYQGIVDTVFRKFLMTARQMGQRPGWEDNMSTQAKVALKTEPNKEFEILHCVFPRDDADADSNLPDKARHASIWLEVESRHIISEGGYNSFPYTVPRWFKSSGELFGRSPALTILGDIKSLNDMTKTLMKTGQKIADPPMMVPDDGFFNTNTEAGGISYYRSGTQDRIIPLDVGNRLPNLFQLIQEKRDQVADAYFTTQLQIIDKSRMTAEEVRARVSENANVIGPTVGRLQDEFLDVLIRRVIDILRVSRDSNNNPILPAPPQEVIEQLGVSDIKVRYISPMSKAQKTSDIQAINYYVGTLSQWSGSGFPQAIDNVDVDKAAKLLGDFSAVPQEIIPSDADIQKKREAQAKQQQAMMAAEAEKADVDMAETKSKATENVASAIQMGEEKDE